MRRSASSGGTPGSRGSSSWSSSTGPTVLACEHFTSLASISRLGIDSRVGALGEHEVAVGLERLRLLRVGPDADEARVHRLGGVLDRALEQQVAARVGRVVVLQRAEVEHLVTVAEVDGGEVGLRARPASSDSLRRRA